MVNCTTSNQTAIAVIDPETVSLKSRLHAPRDPCNGLSLASTVPPKLPTRLIEDTHDYTEFLDLNQVEEAEAGSVPPRHVAIGGLLHLDPQASGRTW
jgi:hypothetical protein